MLLAAAAVLAGATVQSATGFGFALLASPALFAVLEPYEAVSALLALGLVVAGHVAGAVAFRGLGSRSFRLAVLALVVAAGLASVAAGAAGL